MNNLHCLHLTSIHQLRATATTWDDLWWRSDVESPTVRAELLIQWMEQFKPRESFHALVVVDGEQWVAALPLASCRVGWIIPAGGLPSNPWSSCGDLLFDPSADVDAALDCLLTAAAGLSWPLLWLDEVPLDTPRWQALLRACDRTGMAACCHERYRAGRVKIEGTWDIYRKHLPKTHRQGMQRALRRLECEGDVRFEMRSRLEVDEVEPWLFEAFELEDRSWKGQAGTAVFRAPGMYQFFTRQAKQLAAWGKLEIASLHLDDRLLAFVYGFRAKDTYFAHKISYDPDFSAFSPGQLLFHHVFERLYAESEVHTLDFMGPLSQAMSRWRPETYGLGRMALAPHGGIGNAMMYAYQHGWRAWRDQKVDKAAPAIEDSPVLEPAGAL